MPDYADVEYVRGNAGVPIPAQSASVGPAGPAVRDVREIGAPYPTGSMNYSHAGFGNGRIPVVPRPLAGGAATSSAKLSVDPTLANARQNRAAMRSMGYGRNELGSRPIAAPIDLDGQTHAVLSRVAPGYNRPSDNSWMNSLENVPSPSLHDLRNGVGNIASRARGVFGRSANGVGANNGDNGGFSVPDDTIEGTNDFGANEQ